MSYSRDGDAVVVIDQTLLPMEHVVLDVRTVPEMVDAIYRLAVRGAPAIGVAAAFGVLLGAYLLGIALGSLASRRYCRDKEAAGDPRSLRFIGIFLLTALPTNVEFRVVPDPAVRGNPSFCGESSPDDGGVDGAGCVVQVPYPKQPTRDIAFSN